MLDNFSASLGHAFVFASPSISSSKLDASEAVSDVLFPFPRYIVDRKIFFVRLTLVLVSPVRLAENFDDVCFAYKTVLEEAEFAHVLVDIFCG